MDIQAPEGLVKLTEEFKKQIITVIPGIHCAIGYGLANSILIEGTDGNIIIDTLESREAAMELWPEFQSISRKPTVAIIYTHNHADHVCGADILAGENLENVQVFAHATTGKILSTTLGTIRPIIFQRAARQFGIYLTSETGAVNDGIGLRLKVDKNTTSGLIYPTNTFDSESFNLNVAGRELVLYHAPGETDDQIVVYMPKEKVLFAADNIYKAFPNLYAIRGTTTRDTNKWISSLDLMRNLRPEYMIPSHTKPISGEDHIFQVITIYRDAIQFVHDQTVRFMNKGLSADEIVGRKLIQLPDHVKNHPYLQEFYGTIDWSIRGIFDHYLGWYSGKSSDLNPDSPSVRAENVIRLGGGSKRVFESAQIAYDEHKYQWCLELTEYLQLCPEDLKKTDIDTLQMLTLRKLATTQSSANGRNWYLTKSLEIQGMIDVKPSKERMAETILKMPLKNIFFLLSINFDYKKAANINQVVRFLFQDTQAKFQVYIRHGLVVEVTISWSERIPADVSYLTVEISKEEQWKRMIARVISPMTMLSDNEILVKNSNGDISDDSICQFLQFLSLFAAE